jgi:hypothetical protein
MVTVHLTVVPDPRVTATPAASATLFRLVASVVDMLAKQPICEVLATVEFTVMVKLKTNFPVNVVTARDSTSAACGCGME